MPIKTGTVSVPVYLCQFHTVKYGEFFLELVNGYQEPIVYQAQYEILENSYKEGRALVPKEIMFIRGRQTSSQVNNKLT